MLIWKRKGEAMTRATSMGNSAVVCTHASKIYITVANDGRTVTVAEIEQNPLVISCIDMTREEFDDKFESIANVKAMRES